MNIGILRELGRLFSPEDHRRYAMLFGLMVVGAGLDFLGIGLIPAFVAVLAVPDKLAGIPLLGDVAEAGRQHGQLSFFITGAVVLCAVFAVKAVYFYWFYHFQFRMIAHHRVNLATRVLTAYMHTDLSFHLQRNSSELLRNITTNTTEVVNGLMVPLLSVCLGGMTICFLSVGLVLTLPWEALVLFAILGLLLGGVLRKLRSRLEAEGETAKAETKNLIKAANEGLAAFVEARVFAQESFVVGRFERHITRFSGAEAYRNRVNTSLPYMFEAMSVATLVCMMVILFWKNDGDFSLMLPPLAMVGAAAIRLRQAMATVAGGVTRVHYARAAIEPVRQAMDLLLRNEAVQPARGPRRVSFSELRVSHLSFRYDGGEEDCLKDISFTIERGDSVAIVGATGSGKSTLLSILLGLLPPGSGRITVDGTDLADTLRGWQAGIGYVPQSIFLFDDTIASNVTFGDEPERVDQEWLQQVIRMAQLQETINGFPEGLQTVIGERGARISGGQRQRLGIARALYRHPEILIMDEGTSALDVATETSLVDCLREIEREMTTVFVAHRLETILHCRKIVMLDRGRLAGMGTHDELLQTCEAYRCLHQVKQQHSADARSDHAVKDGIST